MQCHSVRDLKDNPSRLFRELEDGETAVLTKRGKPVGVVVPFDLVVKAGAQVAVAVWLLRQGVIGSVSAARMAGMRLEEFIDYLAQAGIEDVFCDEERLEEDLAAIEGM